MTISGNSISLCNVNMGRKKEGNTYSEVTLRRLVVIKTEQEKTMNLVKLEVRKHKSYSRIIAGFILSIVRVTEEIT